MNTVKGVDCPECGHGTAHDPSCPLFTKATEQYADKLQHQFAADDNVHLNEDGFKAVAEKIGEVLQQLKPEDFPLNEEGDAIDWKAAYTNMREWAEKNGVDTTAYPCGKPPHPAATEMNITGADSHLAIKQNFYLMNGMPAQLDIDEELGQLILACDTALDFIHRGPAFGMSPTVVEELYNVRVTQLIPKLKAIIENRVTVQYPYSQLVDMTFMQRNDLGGDSKAFGSLDKMRCTTERLTEEASILCGIAGEYDAASGEPIPAKAVMDQMATMTAHMQQILNLFGWTWDDIKLASRQQIGVMLEADKDDDEKYKVTIKF